MGYSSSPKFSVMYITPAIKPRANHRIPPIVLLAMDNILDFHYVLGVADELVVLYPIPEVVEVLNHFPRAHFPMGGGGYFLSFADASCSVGLRLRLRFYLRPPQSAVRSFPRL